jgi:hypothetical protein
VPLRTRRDRSLAHMSRSLPCISAVIVTLIPAVLGSPSRLFGAWPGYERRLAHSSSAPSRIPVCMGPA